MEERQIKRGKREHGIWRQQQQKIDRTAKIRSHCRPSHTIQMVANSLKMFHQRSSEHTKILSPRILSRQTKHTAAYILHTYTYIDVDVAFQWKCSIFNRPSEITFYTVVCFSCFHFTYNAASTVLIIMYRDAVMFIWAVADVHQLSTVYGLSHRKIQSDIGISLAKFIFARHLRFYKHTHYCMIAVFWSR